MEIERITEQYQRWCENVTLDKELVQELRNMAHTPAQIEDAFYCDLEFGTGGLRGVIGAGTNRMNTYTVAKASQGIADYVKKNFAPEKWRIAISYDSRIKSDVFSKKAAEVFSANGIHVSIYNELMPTPCLSYAVRRLGCAAGVMVTASHNPSKYNGYKVYGADGCQITTKAAEDIFAEIQKLDIFNDVKVIDFIRGMDAGLISWIGEEVYIDFIEAVKKQSVLFGDEVDKSVSIVYSPLNGTGLKPVLRILKESGYSNICVVSEQEQPDGHFPTCPYPNPEIREAMSLGMEYASRCGAELLLATDPDCDRVGIAVKDAGGEMILLSGNETGILLLDFICSQRLKHHAMPDNPVMVKTIVTIDMAERIAKKYGVRTINVLTGFKFIGEQIGKLENRGKESSFIFGFEESYGYLSGEYVRDKDAVGGAFLICEMFAYYKSRGVGLLDRLNAIYSEYGYCLNTLHSYEFEGSIGFERMRSIMAGFRSGITHIGFSKVEEECDYLKGLDDLPASDVLKFLLDGNCSVIIRPSGTEPKLKVYISVNADSRAEAMRMEAEISEAMCRCIGDDGK